MLKQHTAIYTIGDHVVHRTHGICRVEGEETHLIANQQITLIRLSILERGGYILIPRNRMAEDVRNIGTKQDFLDVIAIVSQPKPPRKQHIKSFAGELRDKFREKNLLGLAEIVRDTHTLDEWTAHQLTFYQNAFSHICLEISLITSRPVAEVTQEIKALLIKATIVPERRLKLVS